MERRKRRKNARSTEHQQISASEKYATYLRQKHYVYEMKTDTKNMH